MNFETNRVRELTGMLIQANQNPIGGIDTWPQRRKRLETDSLKKLEVVKSAKES